MYICQKKNDNTTFSLARTKDTLFLLRTFQAQEVSVYSVLTTRVIRFIPWTTCSYQLVAMMCATDVVIANRTDVRNRNIYNIKGLGVNSSQTNHISC